MEQDQIKELVRKAQNRDLAAFETLISLYKDRIYGLCYQLTNNHADAQDLAQEVFIRAYTGLHTFRNEAEFGTWLHRIAVNQNINYRRKLGRSKVVSLDAPLQTAEGEVQREIAAASEKDPEAIFAQKELQRQVHRALDLLSPEHRTVLVLREMQGFSYEEIADLLQCNLGTVKSRINRARQALKELIPPLTN